MIINRKWAMPNKNTFKIKCISELIEKWIVEINPNEVIEPYSNTSKYGTITNDLNPEFKTMYNLDALDFLKLLKRIVMIFVFMIRLLAIGRFQKVIKVLDLFQMEIILKHHFGLNKKMKFKE